MSMHADINLTNLIDVAFVLLIIFMITAPILQGGVEIQLPEAEATPLTSSDAVIVSVDQNGNVFVGETRMKSIGEFEAIIGAMVEGKKRQVTLKGDKRAVYGAVMDVLGVMNALKINDVQLALEPVQRGRT
jgi:biopolymer transport protein TolR